MEPLEKSISYTELQAKRKRVTGGLSVFLGVVYAVYVFLLSVGRDIAATPLGDGAINVGVAYVMFMLVASAGVCAGYTRWANTENDRMVAALQAKGARSGE
ncbi:MAG: DUF485 domain-containing protein [Pseudomonadota bacterium]